MGYVPKDAQWYLAEIVVEITVEGDPRNVVHTNLVLVRADSPEEAFERATELGKQHDDEAGYANRKGKKVRAKFHGLHDLNVIHDALEHGGEIIYQENIGLSERQIQKMIMPKERLGVFRPIRPSAGPDYASKEILDEAMNLLKRRDLASDE